MSRLLILIKKTQKKPSRSHFLYFTLPCLAIVAILFLGIILDIFSFTDDSNVDIMAPAENNDSIGYIEDREIVASEKN